MTNKLSTDEGLTIAPRHPWVAYNTSKSAVLQMARNLACEFGKDGVRVNTISPGENAMTPSVRKTDVMYGYRPYLYQGTYPHIHRHTR